MLEIEDRCRAIPFDTDEHAILADARQAATLLELQREFIIELTGKLDDDDWRKQRARGLADLSWTVIEEVTRGCTAAAATIEAAREAKWFFKLEDYRAEAIQKARPTGQQ